MKRRKNKQYKRSEPGNWETEFDNLPLCQCKKGKPCFDTMFAIKQFITKWKDIWQADAKQEEFHQRQFALLATISSIWAKGIITTDQACFLNACYGDKGKALEKVGKYQLVKKEIKSEIAKLEVMTSGEEKYLKLSDVLKILEDTELDKKIIENDDDWVRSFVSGAKYTN